MLKPKPPPTRDYKAWMSQFHFSTSKTLKELYESVSGEQDHPMRYSYTYNEDGDRVLTCKFQPQLPDLILTLASEKRFLDYLDNRYGGDSGLMDK